MKDISRRSMFKVVAGAGAAALAISACESKFVKKIKNKVSYNPHTVGKDEPYVASLREKYNAKHMRRHIRYDRNDWWTPYSTTIT